MKRQINHGELERLKRIAAESTGIKRTALDNAIGRYEKRLAVEQSAEEANTSWFGKIFRSITQ